MLQRTAMIEAASKKNRNTMDEHGDFIRKCGSEQSDVIAEANKASAAEEAAALEAEQTAMAIHQELHRTFPGPQRTVGGVGNNGGSQATLNANNSVISVGMPGLKEMPSFGSLNGSQMGLPSARSVGNLLSPRSQASWGSSIGASALEARRNGHTLLHVAGLLGLQGGGAAVGKMELSPKARDLQKPRPIDLGVPRGHLLSDPAAAMADVCSSSKGGISVRLKAMELSVCRTAAVLDTHRVHIDDVQSHRRKMEASIRASPVGSPKIGSPKAFSP